MSKNEHPIITQTRLVYKKSEFSKYSKYLCRPDCNGIRISVTKGSFERTMNFLNLFINKIEELNYKIELKYGSSYFVMNGIDIKIYCREKVKKIVKGKDRYGHEEIDYEPTGILVFQTTVSGTREWEDSSLKIEEKIDKMIEYCEFHSKRLKDCHDKQRRKSRKEELVRWLKLKQQQKVKDEVQKIKELFEESRRFEKTIMVRSYLKYLNENNKSNDYVINEKIQWGEDIIEWYDPTINKHNELLEIVEKDTLELEYEYKDHIWDKHIDINEGDEKDILDELTEIILLDD